MMRRTCVQRKHRLTPLHPEVKLVLSELLFPHIASTIFLMMAFYRKISPWWECVSYTTIQIANTLQSLKCIQRLFAAFVGKQNYK